MLSSFADWFLDILKDGMQFLVDLILQTATWFWEALLGLMSSNVVVGMIQTSESLFAQIPQSVWFFMNMCQVPMGIVSILSAYTLRFFIRRIPGIG